MGRLSEQEGLSLAFIHRQRSPAGSRDRAIEHAPPFGFRQDGAC